MPLREEILKPIPGDNPGGQNLRYAPVYEKIKEARREDDELNQGAWQHERKLADNSQVIKLAEEALATQSKDLQLAAWLTEGLLKKMGFGGLDEGLRICTGLVATFWDNLYPELDEGDAENRAANLDWVGSKLDHPLKNCGLCREGFNFYQYKESRLIGYEDEAKTKEQKAAREKSLKEGKLAPEIFDKSFAETPKAFYLQSEKQLDSSLAAIEQLHQVCDEKFGAAAPSFNKLQDALTQVRHVVHGLLQKKRETEPDPVEEVAPEAAATEERGSWRRRRSRPVRRRHDVFHRGIQRHRTGRQARRDCGRRCRGCRASKTRSPESGCLSHAARYALGRTARLFGPDGSGGAAHGVSPAD